MRRAALLSVLLVSCSSEGEDLSLSRGAVFGGEKDATTSSVVMLFNGPADGPHDLCSAVVVAPRVVVTAAHCVADASRSYRVQLGDNEKAMAASIPVSSVHVYPRFTAPGDDQRAGYDLAVLRLERDVGVPAATLPEKDALGAEVDVVGFGMSASEDMASTGVRFRARVPVSEVCDRLFGTGDATHGFCGGDSGGAAFSTSGELVGVIGFGVKPGCAPPGYATRVAPYAAWIRTFIDGAGDATCSSSCPPPAFCRFTQKDAGVATEPEPEPDKGCGVARHGASAPLAWLAILLALRTRTSRRSRARRPPGTPATGRAASRPR